ncbi:MAG TPA: hypothetical protein VMR45_01320 [Patescibacteria group bacterium]|nr:hypothetical protein [Patescibacteria group bacterium]
MFKYKRFFAMVVLGLLLLISSVATAQNVTQGYLSDQELQNGLIVRLKPSDPKKVEALGQSNSSDMLGVVVSSSAAPVSLSDPTTRQNFVATFGKYDVLMSTQNGPIKSGDYITISAVDGVGMKADSQQMFILGKALGAFTGIGDAESTVTLTDKSGGKREVALKRVAVDIGVAHNPAYSGDEVPGVPHFLSQAARLVTKKPLTALRLYSCLGILALAFVVAGAIIYSGVRSGMVAVGRNPLAKKSIARNIITVALMAFVIVIIGVIAVYLLLKI